MEKESLFAIEKENDKDKEEKNYEKEVTESFERIGFHERLDPEVIQRLVLLEKESKFNEDSRKIERGVDNVFTFFEQRYSETHPYLVFNERQRKEGRVAAILHDIGKTGPADASQEESRTIVRLFAQEQIKDPNVSVKDVVLENFSSSEGEQMLNHLEKCEVDSEATMREFWDMHAQWTHDVLEKFPENLNRRIRVIAGSHHFNKGINPYNLSEEDIPLQSEAIGLMEEYVDAIEERVLMAVDQYEASVRRNGSSHERAIEWVRNNLKESKNFKNDKILVLICDAIDELGRGDRIFS